MAQARTSEYFLVLSLLLLHIHECIFPFLRSPHSKLISPLSSAAIPPRLLLPHW